MERFSAQKLSAFRLTYVIGVVGCQWLLMGGATLIFDHSGACFYKSLDIYALSAESADSLETFSKLQPEHHLQT